MGKIKDTTIFTIDQLSDALKRGGREFDDPEDLNSEARELELFFDLFPRDSNIKIFRIIHAKSEKDIDLDTLGNHWTHSELKAREFASDNLSKPWFLITGTVSHDSINWTQTLSQNIHHPYEEELYLNSSRTIKGMKISKLV